MDLEYIQFNQLVRERNEAKKSALKCALIVFKKAQELQPNMRRYMIDNLKEILSEDGGGKSHRLD